MANKTVIMKDQIQLQKYRARIVVRLGCWLWYLELFFFGVDVGDSRVFSRGSDPYQREDYLRRCRMVEACRANICSERAKNGKGARPLSSLSP